MDCVPVPQQLARRGIPRKCLHELLGGPGSGRMLGDLEVEHSASLVALPIAGWLEPFAK